MERLTDEMLARLKRMTPPEKPFAIIVWYDRVVLGDEDGNTALPDEVYYAMHAANAFPILIAEIERLREQVKEYQEVLKPFARPFISERDNDDLEVGFSGITIRDYRRAKAILEKG